MGDRPAASPSTDTDGGGSTDTRSEASSGRRARSSATCAVTAFRSGAFGAEARYSPYDSTASASCPSRSWQRAMLNSDWGAGARACAASNAASAPRKSPAR